MINEIITGIAIAISSKYENITIYADKVEQDLDTPCFLITDVAMSNNYFLGARSKKNDSFVIQYFTDSNRSDMRNKGEDLVSLLRFIDVGNSKMHGTNISYQIIDDVLNFFIDFNYISTGPSKLQETMNDIDLDVRGGK